MRYIQQEEFSSVDLPCSNKEREQHEKMARNLAISHFSHPASLEYESVLDWHKKHNKKLIIDTPELVIGEKNLLMGRIYLEEKKDIRSRYQVMEAMSRAVPHLWGNECRQVCADMVSSDSIPDHKINLRQLMPYDVIWNSFPVDIHIPDYRDVVGSVIATMWEVVPGSNILIYWTFGSKEIGNTMIDFENSTYAELDLNAKTAIASLNFLNQKISQVENRKISRQVRKKMKKIKRPVDMTDSVNFVKLRAFESESNRNGDGEAHYDNWRWMVRGHWRAQWYASEKAHRLIWIDPHIKGPEDAPLKDRAYHVCR